MEKGHLNEHLGAERNNDTRANDVRVSHGDIQLTSRPSVPIWRISLSLILLFLNYFLAQYDKFVLSYFQNDVIQSLHLSESDYGILSGYATGKGGIPSSKKAELIWF